MTGLCPIHNTNDRPEAEVGLLCRKHRRQIDNDLTEIGKLVIDSQWIVQGGITRAPSEAAVGGGKGAKKRADPPAPGDVTLMALFDARTKAVRLNGDQSEPLPAVLSVVASWVLLVAEERPLTAALPSSVLGQLDLLKRHGDWIAGQGWVDDLLLELAELRKALAGVVHDRRFFNLGQCDLPAEDGLCGGALLLENGSDTVRCARCRQTWTDPRERARLAWRT